MDDYLPILGFLLFFALFAYTLKLSGDNKRKNEAVHAAADANYRAYLIENGAASPEMVNSVKDFNIPHDFFVKARKGLGY